MSEDLYVNSKSAFDARDSAVDTPQSGRARKQSSQYPKASQARNAHRHPVSLLHLSQYGILTG